VIRVTRRVDGTGLATATNAIRQGMSAANIREIYESFDTIWWPEQITLTGNQTIDLSDLTGKTTESLVSGKPLLISDASAMLIVGGGGGDFNSLTHAPRFNGEMWLYGSGTATNGTRGVLVNAGTYRLHFDTLWIQNIGGGIQGSLGEIKTVTIPNFFAWDFVAFGSEFYSKDPLKEISEIFLTGNVEGNTNTALSDGIYFSWGPSVGSAGKIGGVVSNGVCYRQKSVAKHWSVRDIVSASWSGGVTSYVIEDYHSVEPGGDVYIGGFDTPAYNNVTSTPWVAAAGTTGKTINVAMANPGSYTVPGYFTYSYRIVPAAFNDFERPRKISYYDVSGRGQLGKVFDTRSGANIVWRRCVADDAGISDPYDLYPDVTWAAGTLTVSTFTDSTMTTPADHDLAPGDLFNLRYFNPTSYNLSLLCASVTDSNTFTAALATDPGTIVRVGNYYKPTSSSQTSDGWYFGERAGTYSIEDCEGHENYRSAVYDDRMTNEPAVIKNNRFYNSAYGAPNPPSPVAEIYARPGRANLAIVNNILGAGDTWRFGSKSFVFSTVPTDGDYVSLQVDSTTEPTYFIFTTTEDNDASQPSVLIATGGTADENRAATIENLRDAIHARDDANCRAVQASGRAGASLAETGTIDRLLIVRAIPGAMSSTYTLGDGSSAITLSPSGTSLSGGTGAGTASYGIMNVRDGERGNVVEGNSISGHALGDNNMDPIPTAPTIRANLLDNGDFSLDQANEGASVTITSPTTNVRVVDRWVATRGTANVTAQRVAGTVQTYGLKVTGAATNSSVVVRQSIEAKRAAAFEGKVYTFSAWVYGTGITRCFLRVATADATDNFSAVTTIKNKQFIIGTTATRLSFSFVGTAAIVNGLELSFRFTSGIVAAQNVTIEGAKLEESGVVTDFVPDLPEDTLFSCQQYYRKTFPAGTAPAQNAGVTGAVDGVQSLAGAVAQQFQVVDFSPPMRGTPTVVLFNPSATNAQIRNTAAAADWSASAAVADVNGITISGTGPGGGTAGQASAVHYTADADFL
jgi:hypothetical protein